MRQARVASSTSSVGSQRSPLCRAVAQQLPIQGARPCMAKGAGTRWFTRRFCKPSHAAAGRLYHWQTRGSLRSSQKTQHWSAMQARLTACRSMRNTPLAPLCCPCRAAKRCRGGATTCMQRLLDAGRKRIEHGSRLGRHRLLIHCSANGRVELAPHLQLQGFQGSGNPW